jgi:hypothetical protein
LRQGLQRNQLRGLQHLNSNDVTPSEGTGQSDSALVEAKLRDGATNGGGLRSPDFTGINNGYQLFDCPMATGLGLDCLHDRALHAPRSLAHCFTFRGCL